MNIVVVGTHSDEMNVVMNVTPLHVKEVIGELPHVYTSSLTGFGISHLWHTLLSPSNILTNGRQLIGDKVSNP